MPPTILCHASKHGQSLIHRPFPVGVSLPLELYEEDVMPRANTARSAVDAGQVQAVGFEDRQCIRQRSRYLVVDGEGDQRLPRRRY